MKRIVQLVLCLASLLVISLLGPAAGSATAGTIKFSNTREASEAGQKSPVKTSFAAGETIYGLAEFDVPLVELFASKRKQHTVVVKLLVEERQITTSVFFLTGDELEKVGKSMVLEVVPDPEDQTQNNFKVSRALAQLPAGRHNVKIGFWSFDAKDSSKNFAEGTFIFESTEAGSKKLAAISKAIDEARRKPRVSDPYAGAVAVRKGGSILLYLRKNEIVKDGAVVGQFEDNRVRKEGSIVGEFRGKTFRHEGADAWQLDKGNLYSGTEVRWEGAIIGDVRSDGTIWWEGSEWGSVKPYKGTPQETMRVLAALYYFSDYFRRR